MLPTDRNQPLPLANAPLATQDLNGQGRGMVSYAGWPPGYGDPAQNGPPGLTAAPTVSALLLALRRRWVLAVGLGIGVAALGILAVMIALPAKYTAQARLRISSRAPSLIFRQSPHDETDPTIWRANQMAILKSPLVINSALNSDLVKKHVVNPPSAEGLESALKIDFTLGPEIMRISLSGENATDVASLVNAVVDAYLEELDLQETTRRAAVLKQLAQSKETFDETLRTKRLQLRKLEKDHNLEPAEIVNRRYEAAIAQTYEVNKDLRLIQSELSKAERELDANQFREKNLDSEPVSPARLDKRFRESPAVKQHVEQMTKQELYISAVISTSIHGDQDPSLPALYKQREQLQKSYEAITLPLRPHYEAEIRAEDREKLQVDVIKLKGDIARLQSNKASTEKLIVEMDRKVDKLDPKNQIRPAGVEKLRDDVTQTEDALKKINSEIANLQVEPKMTSRVIRLQNAEEPHDRDYARQSKFALAAAFSLFFLMLGAVAFWETRSRRVNDGDEISKGLGLGLIGTLPTLPAKARGPIQGAPGTKEAYWQSLMTESVDALRTMLLHNARQEGLQVLMVTSAVGGEGKTSLASQLATSLARAWRKTLLIDGDLRNPAAHQLFNLPLEPGFSEVLRGEVSPDDAIRATALGRLWLMPAGHWDTNAVQALAQDNVKTLFDHLKEHYDFIIVDSCPVLPVADSLLLGQHVDGVLLSVLRDVSRLPSVHAAKERLQALGIRTLGAVVIGGSDLDAYGYGLTNLTAH